MFLFAMCAHLNVAQVFKSKEPYISLFYKNRGSSRFHSKFAKKLRTNTQKIVVVLIIFEELGKLLKIGTIYSNIFNL